ncbi:dihydroorotase [Orrella sp. 11846]|uniref:dihydroorotase n=1 Tax=Orrella sp. 11846 TaxID=3409913 RepID=UPI003B5A1E0F
MTNPTTLTMIRPDDWHLHLRDGEGLKAVVKDTARQFSRAIVMPNLAQPVTTVSMALAYRDRILQALQMDGKSVVEFTPLMTLYLTDNTTAQDVRDAVNCEHVYAFKLYPAGATTNSDSGVTDLFGRCAPALEAMEKLGMPLLVHGEVTDPDVDVFDREAVFIDRVMLKLRQQFPELKVVFEHLTTKNGVDYVREAPGPIAGTLTPQHLLYNRNAIFQGGLQPHWFCLPVLKREVHRQALLDAATSDSPRFFLGTDSAPHAQHLKEASCGCAGCYSALHALELYATAFEQAGRLDRLEAFASLRGPAFYGLPVNTTKVTLTRSSYTVPQTVPFGDDSLIPLAAGTTLNWTFSEG